MKAVRFHEYRAPDVLRYEDVRQPVPGAGEVRIRVRASGINFADILARKGLYPDAPRLPAVVGYEVSGSVDKAGSEVDHGLIGRDVVALTRFGGYSDVVCVPARQVFERPATLRLSYSNCSLGNFRTGNPQSTKGRELKHRS